MTGHPTTIAGQDARAPAQKDFGSPKTLRTARGEIDQKGAGKVARQQGQLNFIF
jgi:hypothetical protein